MDHGSWSLLLAPLSWMIDDGGCWIVFSYMDFFPEGLVGGGFSVCLETEVEACTLCQSVSIGVHPGIG
jgi:hypothetical protein